MKLIHKDFSTPFIDESFFNILVIENEQYYSEFYRDLELTISGEDEKFVLFKEGDALNFDRYVCIANSCRNLPSYDRRSLNKAINVALTNINDNQDSDKIMRAWVNLVSLLEDSVSDLEFIKVADRVSNLDDIIKLVKIEFTELTNDSSIERLEDYLLCNVYYSQKRVFIFDQIMAFLSSNELLELNDFLIREEIYLLDLEGSYLPKIKSLNSRFLLIDQDGCEILIR